MCRSCSIRFPAIFVLICCGSARADERFYWLYPAADFECVGGKKWEEHQNWVGHRPKNVLHFVETARTPDYVELYDKSRELLVRLYADRYEWKSRLGKKGFVKLSAGRWHPTEVIAVAFSPRGDRVASGSAGAMDETHQVTKYIRGTVKVWDAGTGRLVLTLPGHTNYVRSVAFSPDGKRLASSSEDKTVKVWDLDNGKELFTLKGHPESVRTVQFTPEGKRLVSCCQGGLLKVWDAERGSEIRTIEPRKGPLEDLQLSPDGQRVLTVARSGPVLIIDANEGTVLQELQGAKDGAMNVAWARAGNRIAGDASAGAVRVWALDGDKARALYTLQHTGGRSSVKAADNTGVGGVASVEFSPDGSRIVTTSNDGTVKVWDAEKGSELLTFKGHRTYVRQAVFSPDGRRIASCSLDGTVKIWDAATGAEQITISVPRR